MTAPLIAMPRTTLVGDVLAEMYRRDIRNMPVEEAPQSTPRSDLHAGNSPICSSV